MRARSEMRKKLSINRKNNMREVEKVCKLSIVSKITRDLSKLSFENSLMGKIISVLLYKVVYLKREVTIFCVFMSNSRN
jgi:hypothetical protein